MQQRSLGSSGIQVSVVGLGAWAIGGWMWGGTDERKSIAAIRTSLDRGVNLIDTAAVYGYGRSEEIVGRAIQGRREQVVLATKCGLIWDREQGQFHFTADEKGASQEASAKKIYKYLGPASIRDELEKSLRRLKTDYVDLYQTHWQDPTTPIDDTMAELLKLKEQGKIRAIGVSNANLEEIKAYGPIDSDQERYSILDRDIEESGQLEYCRQSGIAVLPYSPLVNGLLTGKIRPNREFGEGDLRRTHPRFTPANVEKMNAALASLQPLAEKYGASLGQLVIAWTFHQPGITCVLCGARDEQQANENAAAGDIELSADELQSIEFAVKSAGVK